MSSNFISPGADEYDNYIGRWSRRLAPLFLDFAGLAAGERVIEVGCGTGSLTFLLTQRADVARVEAIDYEAKFVAAARARNTDCRINVQRGDARDLQFPDAAFDRALSMLVLHFISDAVARYLHAPPRQGRGPIAEPALAEMRRVVRPGGVVAAAVWDTFGGMPSARMFWDIAATLEPRALSRRGASLIKPMTQAGELHDAFARAGFRDVADTMLAIRMDFANFADYWLPMQAGQAAHLEFMAGLPEAARARIEAAVKEAYLCNRPDGPRGFASVAWAVRGIVPG